MKVLVTGAAGFIGSHLSEALLNRGDHIVAIDNFNDYYSPDRKRANAAHFRERQGCRFLEEDIRNADTIETLFQAERFDAVAHLAAYGGVRYSIGRARLYTDVNITGSINLLEGARQTGVKNFVFASTSSVYGNTDQLPFVEGDPCNFPLAPYPASKKSIEVMGYTYHNLHQMNFTALRFFSVYGPRGRGDMMPYMVVDRVVREQEVVLFDAGQMKRDWTYVGDVVKGVLSAIDRPLEYEIINLGRGEPVLMADFVNIIEGLAGKKAILSTPPAPPSEPKVTYANIDKAETLLDYHPDTTVHEGLAKMWDWYCADVLCGGSVR